MSEAAEASQDMYIYRRIPPTYYSLKKNEVTLEAFALGTAIAGLSVYQAGIATPRVVLQMVIDNKKMQLAAETDIQERVLLEGWLDKNPDVESLVRKGWRIVKVPTSAVNEMGFELGVPDENGHLNILGTSEQFEDHKADYIELIKLGTATLLTDAQCLSLE